MLRMWRRWKCMRHISEECANKQIRTLREFKKNELERRHMQMYAKRTLRTLFPKHPDMLKKNLFVKNVFKNRVLLNVHSQPIRILYCS